MLKSLSHNTVSILNDIINMLEFLIDNIFDTTKAEIQNISRLLYNEIQTNLFSIGASETPPNCHHFL
jgi:hypothetical protein